MSEHETVSLRELIDEKFRALTEKVDTIDDKVSTTIELQGETNGRVRKHDVELAVLKWAYAVGAAVMAAWFFDILKR